MQSHRRIQMNRLSTVLIAFIAIAALILAGCPEGESTGSGGGAVTGGKSRDGAKLAANVDGIPIYASDIDTRIQAEMASLSGSSLEIDDELKRDLKRLAFAVVAAEKLALQKAAELEVNATTEEAKAECDLIAEKMGGQEALMAYVGNMPGHKIGSMEEFIEWKRTEITRQRLIDKIGEDVVVDEAALKVEFDKLIKQFEADRDAGKQAFFPAGSFEEFLAREVAQRKLVKFDQFVEGALASAKVEIKDPELEGAIEDYIAGKLDKPAMLPPAGHGGMGEGMGGMSPHGSMGGTSPHGGGDAGGMPPGHPPMKSKPKDPGA